MSFLTNKPLIIPPSEVDDDFKLIVGSQQCFIFDKRKGNRKLSPPLSSQTPGEEDNLEIYKKIITSMLAPVAVDTACILFDFTTFLCLDKYKDQPLEVFISTNAADNESQNRILYIHIMPSDRSTLILKSLSPHCLSSHNTTCTHVGLIIPQELLQGIVSHTSPFDVCGKVSTVSRDFWSAEKFNNFWERFLPAQFISHQAMSDKWMFHDFCKRINSDTLQTFPTKKIIDGRAMFFWFDKLSLNKCFGILSFPLSTLVLESLSPRWPLPVNTLQFCPVKQNYSNDMSFLMNKTLIIPPSEVDDDFKLIDGSQQHCFIFDKRKGNHKLSPPLSSQIPEEDNLEIYNKIITSMLAPVAVDTTCILFDFTTFLCLDKFKDQPLEVFISTSADNESQNRILYIHIMPPDRSTLVLKSPSPLDACGKVSIKFDNIWERFLPAQLISHQPVSDQWMFYDSFKRINSDTLQAFPTKKIIGDGAMFFWLDKLSLNKCFGILYFPLSTLVVKSLLPRWPLPVNTVHTYVGLMGDVSGMNVLPQELIEEIVSRTSPVDVCGTLSIVSRKFRSAAKTDHVWERFLPADLISRRVKRIPSYFLLNVEDSWEKIGSDTIQAFPTKKDLYMFLSVNPLIIDDGDTYFWLDRLSGNKCFFLAPGKLSIPEPNGWTGQYSYYESTLPFRIEGKISTSLLSPNTLYTAYLCFDFTASGDFNGFGEEEPLQTCVGIDGGCESDSRIVYIPFMPFEYQGRTTILRCKPPDMPVLSGPQYPRKINYVCYELELGDYFNKDGGGDNRELKMWLSEIKTGEPKGGIYLHGMEIRPKNCPNIFVI